MPKVWNWQIGREMDYPYDAAYPRRQFAFVINTNRCIGCQTCTMSCKSTWTFSKGQEHMWWTNVETKPYGGYPANWDARLLAQLEQRNPGGQNWDGATFEGQTIFEGQPSTGSRVLGYLPTDRDWGTPNLYEDNAVGRPGEVDRIDPEGVALPVHKTWFFYLARLCNHCSYPACLAACPRQAIYKRPEDGIVLVDQERCRGYRKCVEACPYKKSLYRGNTRTSEKCIACYPRVEGKDPRSGGQPLETRCMSACIGQVRMQGLVEVDERGDWKDQRQHPLYYMVKVAQVALPLYPQFGTEPYAFYIPPRWVPRKYLGQMFGPGVEQAIERYRVPDRELLAVLQLFRRTNRMIARYEIEEGPKVYEAEFHGKPFAMYDDTVIGFGPDGTELFRTKVEEPFIRRPDKHINWV